MGNIYNIYVDLMSLCVCVSVWGVGLGVGGGYGQQRGGPIYIYNVDMLIWRTILSMIGLIGI